MTLPEQSCGKDVSVIDKDTSRVCYLAPEEAVQYGLIDKVLYPEDLRVQVRVDVYSESIYYVILCIRGEGGCVFTLLYF